MDFDLIMNRSFIGRRSIAHHSASLAICKFNLLLSIKLIIGIRCTKVAQPRDNEILEGYLLKYGLVFLLKYAFKLSYV